MADVYLPDSEVVGWATRGVHTSTCMADAVHVVLVCVRDPSVAQVVPSIHGRL